VLFILLDIGYITRLTLTMERPLPPLRWRTTCIPERVHRRQSDAYNAPITFLVHKEIAAYIIEENKPVLGQVPVLCILRLPWLLGYQGDLP
jgi:hypothetical protein